MVRRRTQGGFFRKSSKKAAKYQVFTAEPTDEKTWLLPRIWMVPGIGMVLKLFDPEFRKWVVLYFC
jgi:hypothetical protein